MTAVVYTDSFLMASAHYAGRLFCEAGGYADSFLFRQLIMQAGSFVKQVVTLTVSCSVSSLCRRSFCAELFCHLIIGGIQNAISTIKPQPGSLTDISLLTLTVSPLK